MARENSILSGAYNRLLTYFLLFLVTKRVTLRVLSLRETPVVSIVLRIVLFLSFYLAFREIRAMR